MWHQVRTCFLAVLVCDVIAGSLREDTGSLHRSRSTETSQFLADRVDLHTEASSTLPRQTGLTLNVDDKERSGLVDKKGSCLLSSYLCGDDACCCRGNRAECNGFHRLDYIPKLPWYIIHLDFKNNVINHWTNITFSNVTHLQELHMGNNSLLYCQDNTFNELSSLQTLEISHENITESRLQTCLKSVTSKVMTSLDLLYISFGYHLSGHVLSAMKGRPLTHISMNHTSIGLFNHSEFSPFQNLKFLSFFVCYIKDVKLGVLPNLTQLIFSSNRLVDFPEFCVYGRAMFPSLTILRLDDNFIRFLPAGGFNCMQELEEISMAQNPLVWIFKNTFSRLPKLFKINMYFNTRIGEGRQFTVEAHAFNSSSLVKLLFGEINRRVNQLVLDTKAFVPCPNLRILKMPDHDLSDFTDGDFDTLLGNKTNLTELSLTNTHIGFIPRIISTDMPNLVKLYVDVNQISGWSLGFFDSFTSLKQLVLNRNQIAIVNETSFTTRLLTSLNILDLSRNPYSCTCDNLLAFTYLLKSKTLQKKLRYFPEEYKCNSPSKWEDQLITSTPISDQYCILNSHISVVISVICLCMFMFTIVGSAVYRYRWHIRYRLYMIRFYYQRYQRLVQGGTGYTYDVYLSCCYADVGFVRDVILPHLEQTLNLKVFLPARDILPGQPQVKTAADNMGASHKVVVCMSNAYSRDHYCELETRLAYERVLSERRDLMAVILLDEMQTSAMHKTVHTVLHADEYIMWDGSGESIHMFWQKLNRALTRAGDVRS